MNEHVCGSFYERLDTALRPFAFVRGIDDCRHLVWDRQISKVHGVDDAGSDGHAFFHRIASRAVGESDLTHLAHSDSRQ